MIKCQLSFCIVTEDLCTKDFISFLCEVDSCVKENAKSRAMEQYGSKLADITTQQLRAIEELEAKFVIAKLKLDQENIKLYEILCMWN